MNKIIDIFFRGVRFVRDNPQIVYTIFLAIAIPSAFFFTSEQFLRVARENQDRLERSRIGLLQDTFALFVAEHISDPSYLNDHIKRVSGGNETITNFRILGHSANGALPIISSLNQKEIGKEFSLDELSQVLLSLASGDPHHTYAEKFYIEGERYWRSIRGVQSSEGDSIIAFVEADISMAQADTLARSNILKTYYTLGFIVLLIIVLLARQARIIDYATLYKRLKEVDQMKDDFVSMAAHELRSPLTVIRGYAEMLVEKEGNLSSEGKEYLARIDQSAQGLNTLVGDILDVSRLQEGRMEFLCKPYDVTEELQLVVESFMRVAEDKGLKLSYEKIPLPLVSVDRNRFHQVIVNLVGNAIKYTPTGEVRVITQHDNGNVVIRVSDTGMGISAENQKNLFQKFYRVKSDETAKITGTGLGLWITQQIIKTMKGKISVESIKGKGTDFIMTFPIEEK